MTRPYRAKVMIGIPQHCGQITDVVMRSIHQAMTSRHDVGYQNVRLSLLARGFNTLFCSAYKRGCDFFVLHHADLGADTSHLGAPWIDVLVERMYALNAAAISVAAPIKSEEGHLSMGLDLIPGNHYSLRRMTIRELNTMPMDFISRVDVCNRFGIDPVVAGAMIMNTGIMIIDVKRFPWRELRFPGFYIKDSIEWSLNGLPQSYTEPEDWSFSRWLHRYGLPYFATREVVLDHHGSSVYFNQGEWGSWKDDTEPQPSIEHWRGTIWQEARR